MEIPRHWRLKAQRYRLEGSACPICGRLTFPNRPVCPYCTEPPIRITGFEPAVFPPLNHLMETIITVRKIT